MTIFHTIFLAILLFTNLTAFILFGIDKWRAVRDKWRIPEKTLLTAALWGGAAGAFLGMLLFRHKIRKPKFYILVPILLALETVIFYFVWMRLGITLY